MDRLAKALELLDSLPRSGEVEPLQTQTLANILLVASLAQDVRRIADHLEGL